MIGSAVAATGATLGFSDVTIAAQRRAIPDPASSPHAVSSSNYEFLTDVEVAFLAAALARLIPTDELGPGAADSGGVLFIDRQLAGAYGHAAGWYMQGPWMDGDEGQGFQSRLSPAETYRVGIRAVDAYCRSHFDGRVFHALSSSEQDSLLTDLEKGNIELDGVKAKGLFALLLQNTLESFFSDPLYGGNRDMAGWRLIGFPGARYDYRDAVDKHGARFGLPPVSILGRKAWSPKG
jgi:gluconate 2-dehydrogenase gamma chain